MKDIFARIGTSLLGVVNVKKVAFEIWKKAVKPELEKLVQKTESQWDDRALTAVDYLVEKFLGNAQSAENKAKNVDSLAKKDNDEGKNTKKA